VLVLFFFDSGDPLFLDVWFGSLFSLVYLWGGDWMLDGRVRAQLVKRGGTAYRSEFGIAGVDWG